MRGLLHSPPFIRFIYARIWGRGVLPIAQPARLSASLSQALSVHLCASVGPQWPLVVRLPAPLVPHSASLGLPQPRESSPPLCPPPPPLLVWMNAHPVFPWCRTPLLFDFPSVLVVRGGAMCLPTPPSWFSLLRLFKAVSGSH